MSAKKKTDETLDEPAELPTPEPEPEPETPIAVLGTSQHVAETETYEMSPAPSQYGPEALVCDAKQFYLMIGGVRHNHVGDAPDGRWIYRPDF